MTTQHTPTRLFHSRLVRIANTFELPPDALKQLFGDAALADELVAALSTMLGAAEIDCMDDKSNVWRSAMIDARAALAKVTK